MVALADVDVHVCVDVDDDAFLFANMELQQHLLFQPDLAMPENGCLILFATYLLDLNGR